MNDVKVANELILLEGHGCLSGVAAYGDSGRFQLTSISFKTMLYGNARIFVF